MKFYNFNDTDKIRQCFNAGFDNLDILAADETISRDKCYSYATVECIENKPDCYKLKLSSKSDAGKKICYKLILNKSGIAIKEPAPIGLIFLLPLFIMSITFFVVAIGDILSKLSHIDPTSIWIGIFSGILTALSIYGMIHPLLRKSRSIFLFLAYLSKYISPSEPDSTCSSNQLNTNVEGVSFAPKSTKYTFYSRLSFIVLIIGFLAFFGWLALTSYYSSFDHTAVLGCVSLFGFGVFIFTAILAFISFKQNEKPDSLKEYDSIIIHVANHPRKKNTFSFFNKIICSDGTPILVEASTTRKFKSLEEAKSLVGTKETVWYSENYGSYYYLDNSKEKTKDFFKTYPVISYVIALVISIVFLVLFLKNYYPPAMDDSALQISYDSEYTQAKYDFESVSDQKTVEWIIASYSFYAALENGSYDSLGCHNQQDWGNEYIISYLEDYWGIENRTQAIRTIKHMLKYGSRAKYASLMKEYEKKGYITYDNDVASMISDSTPEELQPRIEAMCSAKNEFGDKAIDAWDYVRLMRITGLCYQCGYFSLDEALDQSLAIAKQLQSEYTSFEEINDSYLYGYIYWSKNPSLSDRLRYQAAIHNCEREIENRKIPYDTKLTKEW